MIPALDGLGEMVARARDAETLDERAQLIALARSELANFEAHLAALRSRLGDAEQSDLSYPVYSFGDALL